VQRKTVTVLFCDVTGSTALGESIDPEARRRLRVAGPTGTASRSADLDGRLRRARSWPHSAEPLLRGRRPLSSSPDSDEFGFGFDNAVDYARHNLLSRTRTHSLYDAPCGSTSATATT
jgi:hypothetical protein